jgi:hypothetical protein
MTPVDVSKWKLVGETRQGRYYEIAPDVLAAVPQVGGRSDLAAARENVEFQNSYWRRAGHPGVVIAFFDPLVSQDRAARQVYMNELDPSLTLGSCLVGSTLLSRAMMSFFLGFAKSRVPIKTFATFEEALACAHELNRATKESRR